MRRERTLAQPSEQDEDRARHRRQQGHVRATQQRAHGLCVETPCNRNDLHESPQLAEAALPDRLTMLILASLALRITSARRNVDEMQRPFEFLDAAQQNPEGVDSVHPNP
eukprot:1088667-Pleurochrysis_carterae.AAC.2